MGKTMDKKDDGLERLCKIYLNLTEEEKEKIIELGEGLLKSQKIVHDEISLKTECKKNTG
jgi:hypothetical protein